MRSAQARGVPAGLVKVDTRPLAAWAHFKGLSFRRHNPPTTTMIGSRCYKGGGAIVRVGRAGVNGNRRRILTAYNPPAPRVCAWAGGCQRGALTRPLADQGLQIRTAFRGGRWGTRTSDLSDVNAAL